MAATSGDQGNGEAGMDVVNTGDLLWWRLWTAPLLIRGLIVIHYKFLHLNKALDDWYNPEVHIWDLKDSKCKRFNMLFAMLIKEVFCIRQVSKADNLS